MVGGGGGGGGKGRQRYLLLMCQSRQLMDWDTIKQDHYNPVGGMRDVGLARYELALLPTCRRKVK